MTTLLLTAFIIAIYTILFVAIGNHIKQKFLNEANQKFHQTLHLGTSFFIGTTAFLSLWVIVGHLFNNAKIGLAISTSIFIIGCAISIFQTHRYRYDRPLIVYSFFFSILIVLMVVLKSLAPMPEYFVTQPELVNPFAGFGSIAHSFRAGNITEHILLSNSFPIIGQHSGQSIIASISLFFGQNVPQLSLTIWIGVFISFLIIFTYGLSRYFIKHRYWAIIPTLIVFLGNSVLSPFYSSITDTESALLLTSNIDSIIGIVTFLILSTLVYFSLKRSPSLLLLSTVFLTGLVWNITSGQMIVLFALSIILCGICLLKQKQLFIHLMKILLVFICGAVLGAFFLGGMLSLSHSTNHSPIPGVMGLKQPDTHPVTLRFPRTGESGSQTLSKIRQMINPREASSPTATLPSTSEDGATEVTSSVKQNELLFAIAKIVRSIQVVFFPLLGLVFMYVIIKRELYFSETELHFIKQFWSGSLLLFSTGWIASTFFIVYGYYWELSKFLYIGLYLAMFCLGIGLVVLFQNYAKYRPVLVSIMVFIILGPVLELFGVRMLGNIYLPATEHPNFHTNIETVSLRPLALEERFEFLINSNGIYGKNHE